MKLKIICKEIENDTYIRLVWYFDDLENINLREDELYDLIAQAYIVNTIVDGVNLSTYYSMDLMDAIYFQTVYDNVEDLNSIEEFVSSVIVRKYKLYIENISKLKETILNNYTIKVVCLNSFFILFNNSCSATISILLIASSKIRTSGFRKIARASEILCN